MSQSVKSRVQVGGVSCTSKWHRQQELGRKVCVTGKNLCIYSTVQGFVCSAKIKPKNGLMKASSRWCLVTLLWFCL